MGKLRRGWMRTTPGGRSMCSSTAPGAIGQIVKCKWYNYASDGQNPTSCCDSGEYYYFYDALGNVNGVLDDGGHYYRWEMDAFGNDLPSGNSFLDMDQPGAKEHLTGKMFDTVTGLYYFAARWYDPQVGRFVSRDRVFQMRVSLFAFARNNPLAWADPSGLDDYLIFYGHQGTGRYNVGRQFELSAQTARARIMNRQGFDKHKDTVVVVAAYEDKTFFDTVKRYDCIKEIHVFSHSWSGWISLTMGGLDLSYKLDPADFSKHKGLKNHFVEGASVRFYGCNVAANGAPVLHAVVDNWNVTACGADISTHFEHNDQGEYWMTPDLGRSYNCISP